MLILTTDFLEIVIKERVMVIVGSLRNSLLARFYHHLLTKDYLD